MSDISTKNIDNDVLDNLCNVLDIGKLNEIENTNLEITLEKLRSTCQDLLLKLHPDKKASQVSNSCTNEDTDNSQLEKVLAAWKFLSKYSSEGEDDTLLRQIRARQYQLKDKHSTNDISKPLWKIITLKSFTVNGENFKITLGIIFMPYLLIKFYSIRLTLLSDTIHSISEIALLTLCHRQANLTILNYTTSQIVRT